MIHVSNGIVIRASAERVWDVLSDVGRWPNWYGACKWVRIDSTDPAGRATSFTWKAHPPVLRSTVTAAERPHTFAFIADTTGIHAVRRFTVRPSADGESTVVVSDETQVGFLAWLGRWVLAPRLQRANQKMFEDLARAVGRDASMATTVVVPTNQPAVTATR